MSIRSDAVNTFTVQVFMLAAGLATSIVVARTLGPEGKGLISFLGYVLFVATSLAALGLQPAAIQHLGKGRYPASVVAGTQIILGLLAGIVCAVGCLLVLPLFAEQMQLAGWLLPLFLPVVVLALQRLNLSGILIGLGEIRLNNWIQATTPAAWMIGAIAVLWLGRGGAPAGAVAWMAAQAIAPALTLAWILRRTPPTWRSLADCARSSLRFGAEAYLANLVWTVLIRSGGIILAYLSGAAMVGIYSIAILMGEALWYLPRSLTTALNPRVAAGTQAEAMHLSLRAARTALWLVIAVSAFLMLFGRLIITLVFGDAFAGSFPPLALLLPGIVAGSIASPIALYFTQSKGRPRVNAGAAALGLVLSLVLDLLWIPPFGANGAAAALSLSYFLVAAIMAVQLRREPGFDWRALLLIKREDLALLRETAGEFLHRSIVRVRP